MIMYPSISICKKYAFETLVFETGEENMDINHLVQSVQKHTWGLDQLFYFFTHPGSLNKSFPCTTTLGGTTPGRPCIFPVTYSMGIGSSEKYFSYECFSGYVMSTPVPACFTKVDTNNSVDYNDKTDIFWGYCTANCNGTLPAPSSPYNLAKAENTEIWTSFFYDLSSWENGFCHTYDPIKKSETDFLSRIYFMMANNSAMYKDYDIFLHEKGQFWPRSDMISFGQPDPISLYNNSEMQIIFSVKAVEKLSTEDKPCIEDPEYSFTKCLQNFLVKKSNCDVNFLAKNNIDQTNSCSGPKFYLYFAELIKLKQEKISKVQTDSGCYPKCKTMQFSYEKNQRTLSWKPNWTSEVFIQPKSSVVEYSTEFYSFDLNDLISSVGGNLGLFLGWSFLTFVEALSFLIIISQIHKYIKIK